MAIRLLKLATIVVFLISVLMLSFGYFHAASKPIDLLQIKVRVEHQMDLLLLEVPGAALAQIGVIHNSDFNEQVPIMLYDISYVRAAHGYDRGIASTLLRDQSLIAWRDFLDDLLRGECRFMMKDDYTQQSSREHMDELGLAEMAICPITNAAGVLSGALFVGFMKDKLPRDRTRVISCIRHSSEIIESLMRNKHANDVEHGDCEKDQGQ